MWDKDGVFDERDLVPEAPDQREGGVKAAGVSVGTDDAISRLRDSILEGEAEATMRIVNGAVTGGMDTTFLIEKGLVDTMSEVGRDFKNGEFYIPDVLMSSRAISAALFELRRLGVIEEGKSLNGQGRGLVVVGTVAGDLHDIGKNIASMLLQCNGFQVIDLGIDVVAGAFVDAVRQHKPSVLGVSALLTTTMSEMARVMKALQDGGVRDQVRVYVSGLPVTQEFADSIGADSFCADARASVEYALSVCGG